jgi:tetratricopeptide (TPR) repeat protein
VVIKEPRGICTYNNVIECPMHPGCVQHDACFDVCAEGGQNSMTDKCHMHCNVDCVQQYGFTNCVLWADAPTLVYQSQATSYTGWIMDQTSGVDFAGYYFFSDPPVFKPVTPTKTRTPTPTPTTIRPTTLKSTPPVTTLLQATTTPVTFTPTGSPEASGTEPPLAVQRQKCTDAGGKWDYFSEGCVIPEGTPVPTIGIPDIFKNKPTIQFTPEDFRNAADDAMKNGQYDLAVQYISAAENIILKNSPDKSSRSAEDDRELAALETAKAGAYSNMGKPDEANEAQNNAKSLNADAATKETPWDLPGFEAAAGILALGLLFLYRRQNK